MRIDKIEIDGFGKLNNFSIELSSGFNLIFGENESGKSTLCDFLLCMFYDMPNDGKRLDLSESLRRKYKPWNSENFGGRVFFSHEGKDYILEKSFGKTKQSDRAKLLDALSWDEAGSAENVGERFFGLGREGFLKTLYITALGEKTKDSGNEELLTKLSNLETGGDEEVSYINIKNALEKEQFSILTKTEKGGKLYTLKEKLNQLATERAAVAQSLEKYKEEEARAVLLKSEITKLQNGIKDEEKVQKIAIEHESFIAEKNKAETRKIISDRIESELLKLSELKESKEKTSEELSKKINSEDIDNAKILEKQLVIFENKEFEAKEKLESFKDTKKARKLTTKILVSAVFVATVFVLSFFVFDILTSVIVGLAAAILSALATYLSSKKDGHNDIAQAENELLKAHENLSRTNKEIDALCQ
ncbi:MAG: AAA family ATPase, partial [Clostridia bacterium]|nr:AAA family ATPase [Clostridia bacterium]